jgi:hypothetical protein
MTVYLKQRSFFPFVDYALFDEKTLNINQYYKEKAICIEESPKNVVPKLYSASILMIHPDIFDKWTDILLELTQRKPLNNIKLFIIHGSDFFVDDAIMEIMNAFFPNAIFWIQNYIGLSDKCKLLPIGVMYDYNEPIIKNKLFAISYVSYNSFYREEFYQFLFDYEQFKLDYYIPITNIDIYIKNLSGMYFTACPMGNGFDTLRFWESLMLRTIPIVKNHTFYDALNDYYPKLPYMKVSSWDELPALVESLTVEKYNEMMKDFDIECLKESFWISQLEQIIHS